MGNARPYTSGCYRSLMIYCDLYLQLNESSIIENTIFFLRAAVKELYAIRGSTLRGQRLVKANTTVISLYIPPMISCDLRYHREAIL